MSETQTIQSGSVEKGKLVTAVSILVVIVANSLDGVIPPAGVPAAVLAIWLMLRWTGGKWADTGLRRPESWPRTIGYGIGLGVALQMVATYALSPLLEVFGAVHDASQFEGFIGNNQLLATYLAVSWTTAGFGEELIWRGFVMTRIAKLFGDSRAARVTAVIVTAVFFGIIHFQQGSLGIIATGFVALVLGAVFFASRRNLWLVFIAHGVMDTIAFMYLYNGWAS